MNDRELSRLIIYRPRNMREGVFHLQEHNGDYYITNTHWLFKINPEFYPKTFDKIYGIFPVIPEDGDVITAYPGETNSSIMPKDLFDRYTDTTYNYELAVPTDYLYEDRRKLFRILYRGNNKRRIIINERYYRVVKNNKLYFVGSNYDYDSTLAVYYPHSGEEEAVGLIMPVFVGYRGAEIDRIVEIITGGASCE